MGSQRPPSTPRKDALQALDADERQKLASQDQTERDQDAQDNDLDKQTELDEQTISLLEDEAKSKTDSSEPENDLDFSPEGKKVEGKSPEAKQKEAGRPPKDLEDMNAVLLQSRASLETKKSPNIEIVENSALQIKGESGKIILECDDPILSASIKRNVSTGVIDSVRYPCGKVRDLSYTDGQLDKVTTVEKNQDRTFQQSTIVRENGIWFAHLNGIKAQLPGRVELTKSGAIAFELDNEGNWRSERPDGIILFEKELSSGSRIARSEEGAVLQVTRADGTCFECKYENGNLTEITEYDKDGNKVTWTKENGKWVSDTSPKQERAEFKVYENGYISFRTSEGEESIVDVDGQVFKNDLNTTRFKLDEDGRFIAAAISKDSRIEGIKYNETNEIGYARVVSSSGETSHYAREQNSNKWMVTITDQNGSIVELKDWHGDINVSKDGKVSLRKDNGNTSGDASEESAGALAQMDTTSNYDQVCGYNSQSDLLNRPLEVLRRLSDRRDQKEEEVENEELDDTGEIEDVNDYRPETQFSGSVLEARMRLTELMDGHLDAPQKERFKIILDRYEKRGENRVEAQIAAGQDPEKCRLEWEEKIAKSYDNLSSMLDPNLPNATYDLRVRAKLVESMAFSMACPVKANDQGNWGCCWMISGVFAGIIQHPDKMTDMLAQLSNTGQYTDLEGQTWTPPKGLLSITSQGGRWTIENCGGGHRSPTSEILTSVAAYLSEDGRRTDRGSRGGTGRACNHAMKKITGDTWSVTSERDMVTPKKRQELLEKGAYICIYPGHMYLGALEKHGDEWVVCASLQHGDHKRRINGTVSDLQSWTITGGRRRYNPDIDLPECQDSPTGPIGNDWPGGGGARDWPFPYPFAPDQWPLSISFAMNLLDEGNRLREKKREQEEEEFLRKKELQRQEEERQLAEIEAAKRRARKAREQSEKRSEEDLRRKKKEEERAKKRREQLKKRKLQMDRLNEERYRKQAALDRAQALETSRSSNNRPGDTESNNSNRNNVRRLSEQILDINSSRIMSDNNSPSWNSPAQNPSILNGLGYKFKPVTNKNNPKVELVSPVNEISSVESNVLTNDSSTQNPETS